MTRKERDDNDEEEENEEDDGEENEEEEEEEGEGADGSFFESFDRVPSGISFDLDLPSSDSDSDDDSDDVRISFASAMAPPSFRRLSDFDDINFDDHHHQNQEEEKEKTNGFDYGLWMAEPMSVKERRRKLLQGMGLASTKNMASMKQHQQQPPLPPSSIAAGAKSRRLPPNIPLPLAPTKSRLPPNIPLPLAPTKSPLPLKSAPSAVPAATAPDDPPPAPTITRSRSDTLLAHSSPSALTALFRVSSAPPSQWSRWARPRGRELGPEGGSIEGNAPAADADAGEGEGEAGVLKIKDLDTGKEIVVSADGAVAGDNFVGSSPIVKEVMRRVTGNDGTTNTNTAIVAASTAARGQRTFCTKGGGKPSKKKANWLKNIKFVASTMTGLMSEKEKEREREAKDKSERLKVHQHGKSYKELTGLYMCQEIQAHRGSIWTMKFSCDSQFLASAGEDRVVHVWQVVECDTMTSSLHRQDQPNSPSKQTLLSNGRSSTLSKSNRSGGQPSKRKKGKGSGMPDYIVMPETIFSLATDPFCSLEGHTDDVLDLSWSKSQYLLSSSMDKSVRLWDIETKTCLKSFAHSDYVTCIQFNPTDEKYFISGSLDAKVRIWSIPDRLVVDWSDLHEMVTATCYTPDGQGALVGSHKGNCRFFNTSDAKLIQEGQIEVRTKKKNNAKKITGFQFAPDSSSEVLITSADSQIRVFDGERMIHKFRGFRNTSSQISASCTMDGKYVVCASEDSHVFIWKRDRPRSSSGKKVTTRSHEHFYCKDVLVAVPWPNGGTNCEPSPDLPSWSRANNNLRSPSNLEDMFSSSRSHNAPQKSFNEHMSSASPEDIRNSPRTGSAIGSSARMGSSSSSWSGNAAGSSISSSTAPSSSSFSSWGWVGNSNRVTSSMEAANSWGLVVVTASLGGHIRVYQNFGLPLRLRGPPF